jgi:PAS domain S-box-containing protein
MSLKDKDPLYNVFNKISDAIIITDLDYNITAWNKAAESIYGWKAEEIIGKNILDTIQIEYRDQKPDFIQEQFEKQGKWKGKVIQYNKNGEKLHIYSSVSIIKDGSGNRNKIVALNQDLSEKKRIEELLKLSERKYKLIVENAHEGIWMIDKEGYTNYVNKRMADMLGYSRSEMMGKHLFDFCDPHYVSIAKKNIDRRKHGIREQHEFIFEKKNGGKIYAILIASPIFNHQNQYQGSVALVSDKTEKKEAERKLRESEEMFRTLAEQSLVGLQIVQDGRVVYVNEKAAEFSGESVENIKDFSFRDALKFIHPDDWAKIKKHYKKRMRGNSDTNDSYQFRVLNKNGTVRWLESLNKTIKYKGENADIIFLVDITDIKNAEKELIISEQKFREAYNRANFYKDLFIHDINNILQVIISSKELLSNSAANKEINEKFFSFLDMIDKQAQKGADLVSNIHKLSELEDKELKLESINVFDILNSTIEYIKNTYTDKKIKIEIISDFKLYNVQANQLLEDVFQNLLINSIKYNNNQEVEILIEIVEVNKGEGKVLRLSFSDNGIGIEDERKELIFQKGTKQSKMSKGLGFGLSLVKIIIEKFNGRIWIEDRVKGDYTKGSIFNIILPCK